jgi:RNA polymerase sigma-70 factor (ECF subfamily)
MDTTRPSLLIRVKRPDDGSAWREFYKLYAPLLARFGRSRGLSPEEAEDVAQECMNVLARKMPTFDYSKGKGSFKNYLFTQVCNQITDRLRKKRPRQAESGELRRLPASEDKDVAREWEHHWLQEHLAYCLKKIESDFSPTTVAAFKLYVLENWPVDKVCDTLSVGANQVYLAKSRVTRRLRSELTELVGDVL